MNQEDKEIDGNKQSGQEDKGHDTPSDLDLEKLQKTIKKRNKRLSKLFRVMELPVRIMGDENTPAMLYDERFVINAYVHNFELRFTDAPHDGNVIHTVKLTDIPTFDKNKVLECIHNYPVRYISKVVLNNTNPLLYLSGYNFLNKEEGLGRYPVFSAHTTKVYFLEEKAIEVSEELKKDGYDCSVIVST